MPLKSDPQQSFQLLGIVGDPHNLDHAVGQCPEQNCVARLLDTIRIRDGQPAVAKVIVANPAVAILVPDDLVAVGIIGQVVESLEKQGAVPVAANFMEMIFGPVEDLQQALFRAGSETIAALRHFCAPCESPMSASIHAAVIANGG